MDFAFQHHLVCFLYLIVYLDIFAPDIADFERIG